MIQLSNDNEMLECDPVPLPSEGGQATKIVEISEILFPVLLG